MILDIDKIPTINHARIMKIGVVYITVVNFTRGPIMVLRSITLQLLDEHLVYKKDN
jgi:hypothetical protein